MNIQVPVSWLREFLKTDTAAKTIANWLTACGPSVEHIEKHGQDYIFDVEVTANRPDAFSIFGLAREAHAILAAHNQKSQLTKPLGLALNLQPETSYQLPLNVLIKNHSLCPKFSAIILDNVKIDQSPAVIKNRLMAVGIRPINNIVDIANYLMLELGQPMHTFDWDKIRNHQMILREAGEGERIVTLDNQTRKLPKGTIVIEDEGRIIDLCGIMGGQNTQITSRTKRVLVFVQAYDPQRIRKTTQSLVFRTQSSNRFEKGVDPAGIISALSRAVYLAKQTAGAKIASELIDIYEKPPKTKPISLNLNKLNDYLGLAIPPQKAQDILKSLGFKTTATTQTITAIPPSWRTQDMESGEDLIEEIARIYGYHNLPSKLPTGQIQKSQESILTQVIELKKALKYLSLTEIISYSIISQDFLRLMDISQNDAVELTNPLTEEWQFMRPTILVSLAAIIAKNQNLRSDLKLFEVAKTYLPSEALSAVEGALEDLPKQDLMLAIVLQNSNFSQIKGLVENVFEILKRQVNFTKAGRNPLFNQYQSAQIKMGDTPVGTLGMLKGSITDYFGIEAPVAAAEINLTTNYQLLATQLSYHPIPKYPPVIEDLSAIFDEKIPLADIIWQIKKTGEALVKKAEVIDIFQNEKIGKGKKSVTLRLTYQRSDRTPTQEEVSTVREEIIKRLTKSFGAIIRR